MAGLMDFWGPPQPGADGRDPVLSLLAPFVTGGVVAPQAPPAEGAPAWAVPDSGRMPAMAGWSAFNQALLRAGEKTLGPAPSIGTAIGDALAAGGQAARMQQAADAMQLRQNWEMGLKIRDQQRKDALSRAFGGFMGGGPDITPAQAPGAAPGVPTAGGVAEDYPGAGVRDLLRRRESGGRPDAVNGLRFSGEYQIGAPLAASAGVYQPGPQENVSDPAAPGQWSGLKWSGTFNIPGFPEVKTVGDFLANSDAQLAAYKAGMAVNDRALNSRGLYAHVGQTVGGVPVTREGLLAAAWLGGPAGVERFIRSNGADNRMDGNGTKVSDYLAMGAMGTRAPGGQQSGAPALVAPPPGMPAEHASTFQRLSPEGRMALAAVAVEDPGKAWQMLGQMAIQDAGRDRFVVLTDEQARNRGLDTSQRWTLNVTTGKPEALPAPRDNFRVLSPAEAQGLGLAPNQRWIVNSATNRPEALPEGPGSKRIVPDEEARVRMGPGYRPGSTYIETVGPDGTTRDIQTMVIADRAGLVPNEPQAVRLAADISGNLAQDPRLRQWRETEPRLDAVLVGLNENTRAGAEAAIESVAKIFDPNAVVRDHKLEMAAGYGGMNQRLNELLGRQTGESGLTTDAKRQLMSLAYNDMKARDQAALAALREARATAAAQGLDPGMVLPKLKLIALQPHEVEGELPFGVTFRAPLVETPSSRFELSTRRDGKPVVPQGQLRPDALSPDAPPGLRQNTPPAAPSGAVGGFDAGVATPLPVAPAQAPAATPDAARGDDAPPPPPPPPEISKASLEAMPADAFAALRRDVRDRRADFTDAELRLIDAEARRRRREN